MATVGEARTASGAPGSRPGPHGGSRPGPHGGSRRRGEDRILTVPNAVTLVRLLCVPLFLWLMLRPHRSGWYPAALLLAALGATDGVDGYVARHFDQVSTLGKVLDPVADRLLLGTAAVTALVVGALPMWVGVTALAREGLVAAGFLAVASLGGVRMDVQWVGKAGTFGLMCALPLFIAGQANDDWRAVAEALAWVCVIPGLALGWYAVATYAPKARTAIEAGRESRTMTTTTATTTTATNTTASGTTAASATAPRAAADDDAGPGTAEGTRR